MREIRVRLLYFGQVKELLETHEENIVVPSGASIKCVVDRVMSPARDKGYPLPLVYAVNENFEKDSTILKDEDVLAIMTPVSGG